MIICVRYSLWGGVVPDEWFVLIENEYSFSKDIQEKQESQNF